MKTGRQDHWLEDNQRYLTAALDRVHETVKACAGRRGEPHAESGGAYRRGITLSPHASRSTEEPLPERSTPFALQDLCETFGLTSFERDVLLLCVGVELDSRFPALCGALQQGQAIRANPTFGLALGALDNPHWSALTPSAPLRRWHFIEVGAGDSLTASPLRIDERVLHHLAGLSYLDERIRDFVRPLGAENELPPSHRELSVRITRFWSSRRQEYERPIMLLNGEDQTSNRAIFAAACSELGLNACLLRARDVPGTTADRQTLARFWEREAVLSNSALLVDCSDAEAPGAADAGMLLAEQIHGLVSVTAREPVRAGSRPVIQVEIDKPDASEQRALWEADLGPLARKLNGQLDALVSQFSLGAAAIHAACADLDTTDAAESDPRTLGGVIWQACRRHARPRLEELAQRIEPAADWNELVLPELLRQTLRDIAGQVRQCVKVYETWGFASKGTRGLGISALFAGVSGTGKTMAAEVLAREVNLDLYRIDLSSVVSKYIGETEKNLRRIFDAAEEASAILLFDEADALFGKRSDVRDSHDRYANIEVSYLLQRMEAYRGLAILTTNMKSAVDTAFLRRIRFVVQFPFPDVVHRTEIWRRVFPRKTPTETLNLDKLARLNITGGNIRNIAMNAAFLAADSGSPVGMSHVLQAARCEYAKMEKPLTDCDVAGWV